MSITSLLVRFGLIYVGLIVLANVVTAVLSVEAPSGVNVALLLGAVFGVCSSYAKANDRPLSQEARLRVTLAMLGIDLIVQAVLVASASASGLLPELPPAAWAGGVVVIGALHALMIYWAIGLVGKQFSKQAEKSSADGG